LGHPVGQESGTFACLSGTFGDVRSAIDDLKIGDAPEGQQCRPTGIAVVTPDLK
jgi:hypothetical protein